MGTERQTLEHTTVANGDIQNSPTTKRNVRKKPSLKQRKALDIMVENGGNASRAMRDAGYSPMTAKSPHKLTESLGFQELMAEKLNDELLARVHSEGLEAYRTISNEDGEVELPDFAVRHKYLETAYKIRDKMPKDILPTVAVQINNGTNADIDKMAEEIANRLHKQKIHEHEGENKQDEVMPIM